MEDLLETQRWYGRRQSELAEDFAESVAAAVERIRQNPQAFPLIHGQIRRLVIQRFPYALYFSQQGAEIIVIALQGRQDPERWQERA